MSFYQKLHQKLINITKYAELNLSFMGLIGTISYPLYYYIWTVIYPQNYENLYLRIFCSALVAVWWLFYSDLNSKLKKYFPLYFAVSCFICMPYFFSFMLIKNSFSDVWSMSLIAEIFILTLLIYDFALICLMSIAGFALACLTVFILDGSIPLDQLKHEYIPIFLFSLVAGITCNYRNELKRQEKEIVLKSLSGSIAHEMRQPLNAMSMIFDQFKEYSQKANKEDRDDMNFLTTLAQTAIIRSNQLISMILNQISDKQPDPESFVNLKASEAVKKAVAEYGYSDEKEREVININIKKDFNFNADETLFIYIIFNLIKNSLFYLKSKTNPKITINIENNTIYFKDNGLGIPQNRLKTIFKSFATTAKTGTGLGLSFCKKTMFAFNGDIKCDSKEDRWTEFALSFPRNA